MTQLYNSRIQSGAERCRAPWDPGVLSARGRMPSLFFFLPRPAPAEVPPRPPPRPAVLTPGFDRRFRPAVLTVCFDRRF